MDLLRDTIMIIGIPREYHETLSKWADERNSKNPDYKIKAETIVEEAICNYVVRMEQVEANLKPADENAEAALAAPDCDSVECSQLQICTTSDGENSIEFSTLSETAAGFQRR
jgi:hypothetical protein